MNFHCTMLSDLLYVQNIFLKKKKKGREEEECYNTKLFAFSNQYGEPKCIYIQYLQMHDVKYCFKK